MTDRKFQISSIRAFTVVLCLASAAAVAAPATSPSSTAGTKLLTGSPQAGAKTALPALNMQPVIPDDPAKIAAAKEFITLFRPRMDPKGAPALINKMMPAMVARAKDSDPKLDVAKFEQEKRQALMARATTMFSMFAQITSHHFSLAELKALAAFYGSRLGRKLVAETPKIQMEIMRGVRAQAGGMPPGMHVLNVQNAPGGGKTSTPSTGSAQNPHK